MLRKMNSAPLVVKLEAAVLDYVKQSYCNEVHAWSKITNS